MKKTIVLILLILHAVISYAEETSPFLKDAEPNPLKQFLRWQQEVRKYNDPLVDVASLATVDKNRYPQQRFMYIYKVDDEGFVFATHANSDKGKQLRSNRRASLIFLWPQNANFLQVRITGKVKKRALAKAKRNKDKKNDEKNDFYEYVLVPHYVQFALTGKSLDVVQNDFLNYERQKKGRWKLSRTRYQFSRVKTEPSIQLKQPKQHTP